MNKFIHNSDALITGCVCSEGSLSTETTTYVPGFKINYNSSSSELSSSGSDSSFLNQVFEKCKTTTKSSNYSKSRSHSVYSCNAQNIPHLSVSQEEIKERCRVSFECRNNMVAIEGHAARKEKKLQCL